MIDPAILSSDGVKAVLARFPGAQIVEIRDLTPGLVKSAAVKVTYQEVGEAVRYEQARAEAAIARALETIASANVEEAARDLAAGIAQEQRRRADIFRFAVKIIDIVSSDGPIKRRMRDIAKAEAEARTAATVQGTPESTADNPDNVRAQRERAEADAYDADVEAAAVAAEGEAS